MRLKTTDLMHAKARMLVSMKYLEPLSNEPIVVVTITTQ